MQALRNRCAQDPGDTDPEVLASAGAGREQPEREDVAWGVVFIFCFYFVCFFVHNLCHLCICIELMNCFCWFPWSVLGGSTAWRREVQQRKVGLLFWLPQIGVLLASIAVRSDVFCVLCVFK